MEVRPGVKSRENLVSLSVCALHFGLEKNIVLGLVRPEIWLREAPPTPPIVYSLYSSAPPWIALMRTLSWETAVFHSHKDPISGCAVSTVLSTRANQIGTSYVLSTKKRKGWHCWDEQICRSAEPQAPRQNCWDMKQSIKGETKRFEQQCGLSQWTLSCRILRPGWQHQWRRTSLQKWMSCVCKHCGPNHKFHDSCQGQSFKYITVSASAQSKKKRAGFMN